MAKFNLLEEATYSEIRSKYFEKCNRLTSALDINVDSITNKKLIHYENAIKHDLYVRADYYRDAFRCIKAKQETFDKITVREFELVDENGTKRVTIQAYKDGEVVFRLRDEKGNIRVKLGAAEDGSGFVLLDDNDSGIQALAKKNVISISQFDKEGKKRVY